MRPGVRPGVDLVAFQGAFLGGGLQASPAVDRGAVAHEGVAHGEEGRQQKVENLEAGARGFVLSCSLFVV